MKRSLALAALAGWVALSVTPASARPAAPPKFLSSAARAVYEGLWAPAHGLGSAPSPAGEAAPPAPAPFRVSGLLPLSGGGGLANVRLNDPTGDGAGESQSETAAASLGLKAMCGWNDSRGFSTGTISSYAYTADGGDTWTDGGDLPLQGLGSGEQLYGDPGVCANRRGHWWFSSIYILPGNVSSIGVLRGTFAGAAPVWSPPVAVHPSVPDFLDKPAIQCDPDSDYVYTVWTRFFGGGGEGQMEFARSLDGGLTWDPIVVLQPLVAGDNVQAGSMVVDDQHTLHVFWEDGLGRPLGAGQHSLLLHRRSTDHGATFSPTDTVATIHANWYSGPPGFNRPDGFFEFPATAVDLSAGPARGTLYVTWNESAEPVFSGVPGLPHAEVEPNNTISQADSVGIPLRITGAVASGTDVDDFEFRGTAGQMVRALLTPDSNLYPWMRLSDSPAGDTLLFNSRIGVGTPIAGWVTLPSTGTYTLQVRSANSTVGSYVVDLETVTPGAGSAARDHRDAVVVTSHDHGLHWGAPVLLNDDPPLFDQCMPMISVDSLGLAHAFWYDRRNDALRGQRADLYYARSTDGGLSWSPNVRVTDQATTWLVSSRAQPNFGDYSTATSAGGRTFPMWADGRFGTPDAFTALVQSGFTLGCPTGDTTVVRHDTLSLAYPVANLSPFSETFRYDVVDSTGFFGAVHDSLVLAPFGAGTVTYRRGVPDTLTTHRDARVTLTGRFGSAAFAGSSCASTVHLRPSLVAVDGTGPEARFERPTPSPARGEVRLRFSLARGGPVEIGVYDVTGRQVARPVTGTWPAGAHQVLWDGRAADGGPLASGMYFVRARMPGLTGTRRVAILH